MHVFLNYYINNIVIITVMKYIKERLSGLKKKKKFYLYKKKAWDLSKNSTFDFLMDLYALEGCDLFSENLYP